MFFSPQFTADDQDAGENGTVSFRYHESTLEEVLEAFELDHRTGDLTLRMNAADLEAKVG